MWDVKMRRDNDSPELMSIGKLSTESGIHASTLRVWEARYQIITPIRTEGGARRYTREDCLRLKWIKALVDVGYKPRLLASLSLDELKVELDSATGASGAGASSHPDVRLGAFGSTAWAASFLSPPSFDAARDVRRVESLSDLEQYVAGLDALVIFTNGLQASLAKRIADLSSAHPSKRWMVVYEFSSAMALSELQSTGVTCLRYPLSPIEFSAQLKSLLAERGRDSAPQRPFFTAESLQTILAEQHKILCECPKHLAQLLLSLHGFVEYSENCADDSPAEALVHKKLRDIATQSIMQLESGLKLALASN
jgi:hypothetical protein